jgi:hypothetical protein
MKRRRKGWVGRRERLRMILAEDGVAKRKRKRKKRKSTG